MRYPLAEGSFRAVYELDDDIAQHAPLVELTEQEFSVWFKAKLEDLAEQAGIAFGVQLDYNYK